MTAGTRRDEIAAGLAAVNERIDKACAAAGRSGDEITLIAVTKTFPASDIRELAELGTVDVGENRDGEAAAKAAELESLRLRWHFVGQVQSRKARVVAQFADVIHSVDRPKLVTALDRAAADEGRTVRVLIQVRLDGAVAMRSGARGGADPDDVERLAEAVAATEQLELGGVMAVAPLDEDPAPAFERLAEISATLRRLHPTATDISAGMSADLEAAVAAGATHLRVGSALLGGRPPLG